MVCDKVKVKSKEPLFEAGSLWDRVWGATIQIKEVRPFRWKSNRLTAKKQTLDYQSQMLTKNIRDLDNHPSTQSFSTSLLKRLHERSCIHNIGLASVAHRLDSSIQRINRYLIDNSVRFDSIYPVDCELSAGLPTLLSPEISPGNEGWYG